MSRQPKELGAEPTLLDPLEFQVPTVVQPLHFMKVTFNFKHCDTDSSGFFTVILIKVPVARGEVLSLRTPATQQGGEAQHTY